MVGRAVALAVAVRVVELVAVLAAESVAVLAAVVSAAALAVERMVGVLMPGRQRYRSLPASP